MYVCLSVWLSVCLYVGRSVVRSFDRSFVRIFGRAGGWVGGLASGRSSSHCLCHCKHISCYRPNSLSNNFANEFDQWRHQKHLSVDLKSIRSDRKECATYMFAFLILTFPLTVCVVAEILEMVYELSSWYQFLAVLIIVCNSSVNSLIY